MITVSAPVYDLKNTSVSLLFFPLSSFIMFSFPAVVIYYFSPRMFVSLSLNVLHDCNDRGIPFQCKLLSPFFPMLVCDAPSYRSIFRFFAYLILDYFNILSSPFLAFLSHPEHHVPGFVQEHLEGAGERGK